MTGVCRALKKYIFCWLLAAPLFCFFSLSVYAQAPVVEPAAVDSRTGVADRLSLLPYTSTFIGTSAPTAIAQAAQLPDTDFKPLGHSTPYLAAKKQWFRFSIQNTSLVQRSFVLNLEQSMLSEVELQASINGVAVKHVLTGQNYPYGSRDIDYDFFAFRLDVPAGKTMVVNLSIDTPFAALFIPSLVSADQFAKQVTFDGRFTGAIMGMLYAMEFFLLIYILYVRKFGLEFLMWLFAATSMLSAMNMAGMVQRYIPDAHSVWRDMAFFWIHALQGMAFAMLLCGYYQARQKYPKMFRACIAFGSVNVLCLAALPWLSVSFIAQLLLTSNTLLMCISFGFAIWTLIFRRQEKKLFSVGLIAFVLMSMMSTLAVLGVPMPHVLGRYSYELGLSLEVSFLVIAVIMRIVDFERERSASVAKMLKLNADMDARSEFVDRVTHDIKSPLSAVVGAVQLLRETSAPEKKESYLNVIQHSCNAVIGIVDSILSYSRLKSGHMSLQLQPMSIRALVSEIENALRIAHRQKQLDFIVTVAGDVSPQVIADKGRLYQLLNNLLTNAFKFTDHGRVSLDISVAAKELHHVSLRFVVRDTGIGMSPEFLEKVFEPYAREEAHAGYRPGFGLGLPICKQIVELMHGTIEVSSQLGEGSCFIVTLSFDLPH
ncbi:MAG: sensor histidine kinase [Pseudomonadales bacterium]